MVHIIFDPKTVSFNDYASDYYQIGNGEYEFFKGLPPYQRGFGYQQKGAGLGDILRSVWRILLPVLKTTGSNIGKEALSTGSRILEKVAEGENFKDTIAKESVKGVDNLLEKGGYGRQFGSGAIKRKKTLKKSFIPNSIIGKQVKLNNFSRKRKRSDAFGFY